MVNVDGPGTEVNEALGAAVRAVRELFGPRALVDAPLGARTTYRVGGRAALLVRVDSGEDLIALHEALAVSAGPIPVLVLGQGSNLLVSDAGFTGVVVELGEGFDWVEVDEHSGSVRAGGATKLPVLARKTAKAGFSGLEWAVGVPGSVGGALRMNAGGHGSDTKAVLESYCSFDLASAAMVEAAADRLHLGYRRSALGAGEVALWAQFALARCEEQAAETQIAEVVRWRREHQPGGSNAGSIFTNPAGDSAGRLVEAAGLKGLRLGTAVVSDKHANFIQADEGGSADDVRRLIDRVRDIVAQTTDVTLTTEVCLVGFADTPPSTILVGPNPQPKPRVEVEHTPRPHRLAEPDPGRPERDP